MLDAQTHIFYKLSVEEALKSLDSDISGISESEAESRQKKYGLNELTEKKHITPLEIFINQFKSVLILILIVAAGISGFILHEYTDMAVILVIVILNSIIGFIQEYRAEQAVEALKKMVSQHCKVRREGEIKEVSANKVVPGDILVIQEGDRIPADGRLIEAFSLKIDESPLTGESSSITKKIDKIEEAPLDQRVNMVYKARARFTLLHTFSPKFFPYGSSFCSGLGVGVWDFLNGAPCLT